MADLIPLEASQRMPRCLTSLCTRLLRAFRRGNETSVKPPITQVEDFPSGYPRFAALISSHPYFQICRRFSALRARMLLHKQDKLSQLEEQLEQIDREEPKVLFLGSYRRDSNPARKQVLENIDAALADYDELIHRNERVLGLERPNRRDIANLENWIDSTGCLARQETAYLGKGEDLATLASPADRALNAFEGPIEGFLIWIATKFNKVWLPLESENASPRLQVSRDPNVHIFSSALVARLGRFLVASLLVLLLLIPVIIVNAIDSVALRLLVIAISSTIFIIVLSMLTKARTGEIFVAGATFTTVLVVFVAGTGSNN
ncbi:hypothetical protein BU16DRAFT_561784 [Lophium mytilinum]|uniref:DUF6594 domain-containing protein n=1 Tax=Lophium mytilinum TaxID=390894 RepID=A0A6A6QU65_9PEZI|nr:hypothetical protein BU16DRAFT_561784 [Lophium mytilinum]